MINKSFNTSFWGHLPNHPKLRPLIKRARGPFCGPFWEQTLHFSLSKDQCGFTLAEIMIAMVLGILVISGVTDVFISQQKAYNIQDQVSEMQQNARVAMDRITRSIRSAGYDPRKTYKHGITNTAHWDDSNNSLIDITSFNEIHLTTDVDSDGIVDNNTDERIGFRVNNNTLEIYNITDWKTLAENIESLSFVYTFSDGGTGDVDNDDADLTNETSDIRSIKISLTARTSKIDPDLKSGDGYRRRTLTASVKPRNLGLE